jgi:hypothetical protein
VLKDENFSTHSHYAPKTKRRLYQLSTVSEYSKKAVLKGRAAVRETPMELLSIIDPPITDLLDDPRVTSAALLKLIASQQTQTMKNLHELSAKLNPGDVKPYERMMFACLQQHLSVTTLHTKLAARQVDLSYKTTQLNVRLESLTKWLIGLTIALGLLTLPLAIEVVENWFR